MTKATSSSNNLTFFAISNHKTAILSGWGPIFYDCPSCSLDMFLVNRALTKS